MYKVASIKTVYTNEITYSGGSGTYLVSAQKTYSAKIGLMYASDYGYAASPTYWNGTTLYNFYSDAYKTDWMYMGEYEWTISRSPYTNVAYGVLDTGNVYNGDTNHSTFTVRPVFYLTSSTAASGSHAGTESDPLRVS
jgi:hypothetical protein